MLWVLFHTLDTSRELLQGRCALLTEQHSLSEEQGPKSSAVWPQKVKWALVAGHCGPRWLSLFTTKGFQDQRVYHAKEKDRKSNRDKGIKNPTHSNLAQ